MRGINERTTGYWLPSTQSHAHAPSVAYIAYPAQARSTSSIHNTKASMAMASAASTHQKLTLAFILDGPSPRRQSNRSTKLLQRKSHGDRQCDQQNAAYMAKRRARECSVDGCTNYTINRGRCFRHGGGKKCSLPECDASAKIAGRCWKHGGSIQCVVSGCDRRGKSRGLCWSHGGGTLCQADACQKVAVSHGFCWAHGGGKRCLHPDCARPAYERTNNYCPRHFQLLGASAKTSDGKVEVEPL